MQFQMPSIMNAVDSQRRISSKWISKESGKSHFHILRDIETLLNGANPDLDSADSKDMFSLEKVWRKNGTTAEILMGLPLAIAILSRYTGPKAHGCLRLVVAAVEYFMHRAPLAEKRIKDLEIELAAERSKRTRQSLPHASGPSKVLVRVFVEGLLPGFESYFKDFYVSPEVANNMPQELETAKLAHLRRTEAGVSKKRKRQEDFVLGVLN